MRIVIPISLLVQYQIDFGFNTPIWSSMYWFTINKVWFDEELHEVEYASIEFSMIKH